MTQPVEREKAAKTAKAARAPWHFWVLVAAAGSYLAWRAFQGIAWLAGRL